uniref:Ycf49-like protein n=1 Tax=Araucaria cunninghamii TaxID=56994 RepID=A0A0D6QZP3_ARACU
MAALVASTLGFSISHVRPPSSTLSLSTISCQIPQHLGANNPNPEDRYSKNLKRKNAYKAFEFYAKPKLLSASNKNMAIAFGAGTVVFFTLAFTEDCYAVEIESNLETIKALMAQEPKNALSLPTWAIHVSSVVEWVVAMALVWQYGDKPGRQAWKGLSWGMVPLLGGAMCACTWHFFYNAESLEILVAIQGALTVIGNFTMMVAAYRIYESTKGGSEAS